jgi:hypothetical protein
LTGAIILSVATLLATIAWLLAGRRTAFRRRRFYIVFFLMLAAVGAVLTLFSSHRLHEANDIKSWPTVTGTVVDAQVTGERAFAPTVTYTYKVRDSQYTAASNLQAPMFGGKRKKYEVAQDLIARYPPGKKVTVYYNPQAPATSTLIPRASWDVYAKLGLGTLLYALGLFGFLLVMPGKHF